MALQGLSGKHIYDVILEQEGLRRKVNIFLKDELKDYAINFLKKEGFDPKRVYIKAVLTHRRNRTKRLDFKGRGRSGIRKKDYVSYKIEFVEKSKKNFYRDLVNGDSPVMF